MSARPVRIAVMALGGQGGGVLAEWIVKAGERAGYVAQSTSVPGVAQRTGATIYYVELFPQAEIDSVGASPILALMPAPGDVDIVIAAELMEAGRALNRGFVTSATTLIASTHRIFAIGEKIAMSDGRQDAQAVRQAVEAAAGRGIWFDMERAAEESGAVISAVMFGALAGSGATPIPRAAFEETIRSAGRAVERNLTGFASGFDASMSETNAFASTQNKAARSAPQPAPAVAPLLTRVGDLPANAQAMAREGLKRVVDFQDPRYGSVYLDRLEEIASVDRGAGGETRRFALTAAVAKYLALAMAYDDVVRVADLKTRSSRFVRFREDVRAADGQIVRVWEYMHPRLEEACDLLPPALARSILSTSAARKIFDAVFGKGRRVATTNLSGFFLLNALASLKFLRRGGLRFDVENERTVRWLELVKANAAGDYALACEIASLQRLIKGYGETHERGLANYRLIIAALDQVKAAPSPAQALARLRDSALKDEDGVALRAALSKLGGNSAVAAA